MRPARLRRRPRRDAPCVPSGAGYAARMSDPARDPRPRSIHVESVSKGAPVWFIGWLFTIGFADLSFGRGLLAVLIWPVYLGELLRS